MNRKAPQSDTATRRHILHAALKVFAHRGYAGATVQEIVTDARVSKPALYYYFKDKAALYQALVNEAHDERHRIMREAAERSTGLKAQLVEILADLFDYFQKNRELTRLAFSTPLAAPGELPKNLGHIPRCRRNMEFIRSLMEAGQASGELGRRFGSLELAYGFYGQMNFHIASHLFLMEPGLDRDRAEQIVELFLFGASGGQAAGEVIRKGIGRKSKGV